MEAVIAAPDELARLAAGAIEKLLRARPDAVLGLATGSSPLPIYDELARLHVEQALSFAGATAFTLDEYVGLAAEHPQRYLNVITREIAERVDFAPGAVRGSTVLTAWQLTFGRHAPSTRKRSPVPAASTCRSWVSAPMGTSASTSQAHPLPPAPVSRPSRSRPEPTTRASSMVTSTRFRTTA